MWRSVRCVIVPLELALATALALGQACGPLPAFPAPAGAPPALTPRQETWVYQAMKAQSLGALGAVHDAAINAELDKVLARLASALPPLGFPLRVHLILRDYPDSFAMPGGQIYITRPMIAFLRSEDELAGILAHELGHEYSRQLPRMYADAFRGQLGLVPDAAQAGFLAQYQRLVTWSQRHELKPPDDSILQEQADRAGLEILQRSGYDPRALPRAFARFTASEPKASWLSRLLGQHTPDVKRLQSMLAELPAASCPAAPRDTPAQFQAWQAKVEAYAPPPPPPVLPGLIRREALPPLRGNFGSIEFSLDGKKIAAWGDGGAWIYSVHPLVPIFHIAASGLAQVEFGPRSRSVVLATTDGRLERWNLATRHRDLLRQVVGGLPPCTFVGVTPDARWLACAREKQGVQVLNTATSAVAYDYRTSSIITGLDFSPDGHYLAIKVPNGGRVIALATMRRMHLPGSLSLMVNPYFSFVSGTEVLGTGDAARQEWRLAQFPSGKTVKRYKLFDALLTPETSGPYVIYRLGRKAAVIDPATGRFLLATGAPDLDGYGKLFAGQSSDGGVELVRIAGHGVHVLARAAPPTASFDVAAAAASPDLRLLAVSTPSRGAVWDLATDHRIGFLGGFFHAWLDGADLWLNFDGPPRGVAQNATATYIVVYDLRHGGKRVLPAPKPGESISVDGPILGDVQLEGASMVGMFRDTRSGKLLWQRRVELNRNFAFSRVLPGYGQTLFLYGPQSRQARRDAQEDAALERAVRATSDADGSWLEVLDSRTGKLLHGFLLKPSPTLAPLGDDFGAGDWLYLSDGAGRVFVYSDTTGRLLRIGYGLPLAAAPAAGLVALVTGPRRLALAHGAEALPVASYVFPHRIEYARFSGGGRRLLVVTRDENAYLLGVPEAGEVQ